MIVTNFSDLESGNILTKYEAPNFRSFREEVENVKICFRRRNFITNVGAGGATNI